MKENAESRIAASHLKADADYRLWQFHMHWSDDPHKGSEHCIHGLHFAAEVRTKTTFKKSLRLTLIRNQWILDSLRILEQKFGDT